jgi:hypothetical protein
MPQINELLGTRVVATKRKHQSKRLARTPFSCLKVIRGQIDPFTYHIPVIHDEQEEISP